MIERYFYDLPQPASQFALELRKILLNLHPAIEEHYKWGLPYYTLIKGMAYIHYNRKAGLYLSFLKGKDLIDENQILQGQEKLVRKYYVHRQKDLHHPEFYALLQQAIDLNLSVYGKKNR